MISSVKQQIYDFKNSIDNLANSSINLDSIKENIKSNTKKYHETSNEDERRILKENLIKEYNVLYYLQVEKNGIERIYMLDDDIEILPDVYVVEQKPVRFEVNDQIIDSINVSEGLTMEQAIELLKWTVNNTRDNMNISKKTDQLTPFEDVYGNDSLTGYCGFSQYSTLYLLQKLGLHVTINNVGDVSEGRHAYGTVVMPIKMGDSIVNKRFLLDCTYRQVFTVPFNISSRYLNSSPNAGFFIHQDEKLTEFSKELLKNGFVEASLENLEKYLKPFFAGSVPLEVISKVDEKFSQLDLIDVIENKQGEFDYEEEEFIKCNCNLSLHSGRKK